MIRTQLRRIERQLVLERAEREVDSLVEQLRLEWDVALCFGKPLPDPFAFSKRLMDAGFYLPNYIKAIHYLSECKQEGKIPERRRLLEILLPWSR